ncbi:TOMM precursor leader peptide-binding protein [Streptomyces sp. NPDC057740]|uniref:TOMM precursor leader peptide-binding protein n=1 Tax=Streptomyces sp. NPDC057740 TaxID=3346234 RepID=UPI0036C1FDA7
MDSEELFLRQDAAFLETPEGVLLRGGGEDFFLKGTSAYRWLTALAPALSVGCTAERLCAGLDADRAAAVRRLLAQLVRSGFLRVRRVEPEGVLDAATRSRFAEQISYLAHHTDTPQAAFRKVREARVLVVGEGPGAASAVRLLLRNGVRQVALCGSVDDAPDDLEVFPGQDDAAVLARAASWRPDALLVLPEGPSAGLVAALADHAAQRGPLFLAGHATADRLLLGPLVRHGATRDSCWHCLRLRTARTGTTEASGTSAARGEPPVELFPAVSAAAGSELAAELFRTLSGCIESELVNGVVLRDPLSLESTREPLAVHPSCPHCNHEESLDECTDRILELSSGRHDLPRDSEQRAAAQTAALAPTLGPLADYDDQELPQLLVKTGRVRAPATRAGATTDPGTARHAYGFSFATLEAARIDAVERMVRRTAADDRTPSSLPKTLGTWEQLTDEGSDALSAARFGTRRRPAAPGDGPAEKSTWVPAFSLSRRTLTWIPQHIAFAPAGTDSAGAAVGYGAGATFEETALAGVLSVLLHERVEAGLRGEVTVQPLELTTEERDSKELSILPALRRSAGEPRFGELPAPDPAEPARVVVARAEPPTGGRRRPVQVAAIGLTRAEALHTAVLELAGLLQLPYDTPRLDSARSLVCPASWPPLPALPECALPASAPPESGAVDLAGLLAALARRGREAVLVSTLPPAVAAGLPALTGRVLLTR